MFDHVTIRVGDFDASERFYRTVLDALDAAPPTGDGVLSEWRDFSIALVTDERPPTQRLHIGFSAPSRAHVDAFWAAGVAAGYRNDGAPGPRDYTPDYYGAFLLDPDGNSAEAVHHEVVRRDGTVDHLWIRVSDVAATAAFYDVIAPFTGLVRFRDTEERAGFERDGPGGGTFSLVSGPPTQHLHMAFPSPDDATVRRFHAAALAAGYRDNGAPGERPECHPGYFGAFVLDPAGANVELVCHHRG